jgi:hypothetical protein
MQMGYLPAALVFAGFTSCRNAPPPSTLTENLQHGYLALAVEAAAEKSETEVVSVTDLLIESLLSHKDNAARGFCALRVSARGACEKDRR